VLQKNVRSTGATRIGLVEDIEKEVPGYLLELVSMEKELIKKVGVSVQRARHE